MIDRPTHKRVLALDPTHRRFGYVIFEGSDFLIDWGVRQVQGVKNRASLVATGKLIGRYHPQIIILEDVAAKGCRRRPGVKELLTIIDQYARERGVTVRRIPMAKVIDAFALSGVPNKDKRARFIAARFPELARSLPPERKPWMSEDERMAIFDAAAFGLEFFRAKN